METASFLLGKRDDPMGYSGFLRLKLPVFPPIFLRVGMYTRKGVSNFRDFN